MQSTFVEGDGLPVRNWTMSVYAKMSNHNRLMMLGCDWAMSWSYDAPGGGVMDVYVDSTSYNYYPLVALNMTNDELLLQWHMCGRAVACARV